MNRIMNHFFSGRLCLIEKKSDWASLYRTINISIIQGQTIVTGIAQGIYVIAEKLNNPLSDEKGNNPTYNLNENQFRFTNPCWTVNDNLFEPENWKAFDFTAEETN